MPGSSQLFNNHIPLDPRLDGAVAVTKTTPMLHVTRGQLVPYVITVSNSFGADLRDVNIVDRFPAGFRYVEGSARFDDVPTEPVIAGRELTWSNLLCRPTVVTRSSCCLLSAPVSPRANSSIARWR